MKKSPVVSVITVVYNDARFIEATLNNIIQQPYKNIEYIVVDGASTDGTKELIEKHIQKISHFISEPDSGLYDAMNKALNYATGDYVIFINSGDTLAPEFDFRNIFKENQSNFADFYYGNTTIVSQTGAIIGKRRLKPSDTLNWKSFKKGMLVSHQAMLVRKKNAPNFDLKYKHAADFDWAVKCLKKSTNIVNTHKTIAYFQDGGHTSKTIIPGLKERFTIMIKHYGLASTLWQHLLFLPRFLFFYLKNKRF